MTGSSPTCSRRTIKYIETDVVYGVKTPLIVDFTKKSGGKTPTGETLSGPFQGVRHDFVLIKQAKPQVAGSGFCAMQKSNNRCGSVTWPC
jgi:hypothetical protein